MTSRKKLIPILPLLFLVSTMLGGQTVFTYRSPESSTDSRFQYDNAVLKLALDKTVDTHGDYILQASPSMNFARAHHALKERTYENPMFKSSATNEFCRDLDYVNFPIDLGIVGYRVFFASTQVSRRLGNVKTLEDLKQFSLIQGIDWADIDILKNSGFRVVVQSGYESLFPMVASGRVELFPRGANEVKDEMQAHSDLINLALDDQIILYYPLPRFFFTNKGNQSAIDRVYRGLIEAYEDGSLLVLWKSYYQESVDFAELDSRHMIRIENPLISDIDRSYEQYIIQFQSQE